MQRKGKLEINLKCLNITGSILATMLILKLRYNIGMLHLKLKQCKTSVMWTETTAVENERRLRKYVTKT